MVRPQANEGERMLTEAELEFMTILWRLEEASVNDLLQQLPAERRLAYTSVSTIMRILEQKGVVKTRKEGRGHIYIPQFSKEEYEKRALSHVIDKVFDSTPVALVKRLVDSKTLSKNDLDELRRMFGGDHE